MSALFQINFRREAFRREREKARQRAVGLGVWVTYFGVLVVLLGLYGLNGCVLASRTRHLERQIARQRTLQRDGAGWVPSPTEAAAVEPWVGDIGRWRALLERLPRLLPDGARLTSMQWNPEAMTGGDRRLLLHGILRADAGHDRMAGVTDMVTALARDPLFAGSFRSVRLLSTRVLDGGDAEFELECK